MKNYAFQRLRITAHSDIYRQKVHLKRIENVNIIRLAFLSFYQVDIEDDIQILYEHYYLTCEFFLLSKNIRESYVHVLLTNNCHQIYSLVPRLIRQQQVQIIQPRK